MSARDRLFEDIWDMRSAREKNALIDAYRDEVAREIGQEALREEPRIHSGLTDVLPQDHPLKNEHLACGECNELLHCCINENMQTWVEARRGNYCLPCFAKLDDLEGSDAWGVPR